MAQRRPVAPLPHLRRAEVGQPLDVHQPVDPAPGRAMPDRARGGQALAASQVAAAPRSVHHPCRRAGDLLLARTETEAVPGAVDVRRRLQLYLQAGRRGVQLEARRREVDPQQLRLEHVAVELVGDDVRQVADIGLIEILVALAGVSRGGVLPIKAQVVLHVMFATELLLYLQHPCVVIAALLHGRLAHLLLGRRQRAPIDQQLLLARPQQELAGQAQPGQPAADDQHVHVSVDALYGAVRELPLAVAALVKLVHAFSLCGRLRPYISCALTNSPLASAAPIDSSPASSVAAAISASFGAPPAPAQPSISRHSRAVPWPVPPPTVATVSDGRVTLA